MNREISERKNESSSYGDPVASLAEDSKESTPSQSIDLSGVDVGESKDDVATMIASNWQRLFALFGLFILGVWVYSTYRDAEQVKLQDASTQFIGAQKYFEQLLAGSSVNEEGEVAPSEELENTRTAFSDSLKLIEESGSASVYSRLAPLYQASSFIAEGKAQKAGAALRRLSTESLASEQVRAKDINTEQLVAEFSNLLDARAKLVENSDRSREEAAAILKGIVSEGVVLNAEAAIALNRMSINDEEKLNALNVARELRKSRPEFESVLDKEFPELANEAKQRE